MKEILGNKKKLIAVCLGLVVVAAIIVAVVGWNANHGGLDKNTDSASSLSEQSKSIDAWAEVKYDKVYDISIDFPSTVTDIPVKEGDHVTLGDVLVTLDSAEYQGNLNKLQQQQSAVEADITQTQNDISTKSQEYSSGSKAELKLLQNSLTRAKKEVADAKKDAQDYQSLYNAGAVSKDTLDQYNDVLNQKQKAQTDVEDNIAKTKRSLQDELNQLNLALKSKQAQLEQIKIDINTMKSKNAKNYLKNNQIVSCVKNGIVQNISVMTATKLGMQNAPVKVLQLIDADSVVISAEIEEEFIEQITLGQTVSIVPTANKKLSIPGTVTQISNVAVEKDGKRIVKAEVKPQQANAILKPGYTADVYFPVK